MFSFCGTVADYHEHPTRTGAVSVLVLVAATPCSLLTINHCLLDRRKHKHTQRRARLLSQAKQTVMSADEAG